MRRLLISAAAVLCVTASSPVAPPTSGALIARTAEDCQDYCAEKAAAHCERIDSWGCTWYILGCLAGCNVARL